MATFSAQDIKQQLIKDVVNDSVVLPPEITSKSQEHIDIGIAVRRMIQTTGWKIFELWMLKQIDLWGVFNSQGEEAEKLKAEGRVYGKILTQINYWVSLAERLENIKENKEAL
jgi:hypothetical protein